LGEDIIIQKCRASKFCCRAMGFQVTSPAGQVAVETILKSDFIFKTLTTIFVRHMFPLVSEREIVKFSVHLLAYQGLHFCHIHYIGWLNGTILN